ncbi:predicted protein [Sclerotinia sclerotiorum 1980 UF-70]|uniref:Uncharacterized protein n=2 Tax=Sclerotinia sclerotiorum (strain ATCC 18683 / 1980 / Ss-1) TaxID=665079 RepID=A7F787_SCLS1|nr:predicted protein [Sclerotinia sclerotiorum 1980 UF-70]APA15517.1 hypothetical protein sscle_15g102870 [Sclerotinia sclerotiorum 1980 UF-70]EDN98608.1 predicted protein [Sclerotinia sclerotiorum 1980 UF-70]
MVYHKRSKSSGNAQQPNVGSNSKSAEEEGLSSFASELTRRLDELITESDEEDLEEDDSEKRELRRQRRMKVREGMETTRGAWDTERDELAMYADALQYTEAARVWIQERKKEELRTEKEEGKSLDKTSAASKERKEKELKELGNTFVKKITKIQSRKLIRKTLREELEAYAMVKAANSKRVRDAKAEVDETKLKEIAIKFKMMRLWQNEVERWGEELEIPTLAHKSKHSPADFSADDAEYLRTSLENLRTHRDWCMNGPRLGEYWFYNGGRQYECDDCKDDITYKESLQNGLQEPSQAEPDV